MKIDAFKCDWCEAFGTEFDIENLWFTLRLGEDGREWHFCTTKCLANYVEDHYR